MGCIMVSEKRKATENIPGSGYFVMRNDSHLFSVVYENLARNEHTL